MIIEISTVIFLIVIYYLFYWEFHMNFDLTSKNIKSSKLLAKYTNHRNRTSAKIPPVYPNGWYFLIESRALKRGQVEYVASLGQNFAVFRTDSGKACVLDAYCPHLGTNMAINGKVVGEELKCIFHDWRFCGETGKCTNIPYAKNPPKNIKTKVWECLEINGIVMVWFHAESEPSSWCPPIIEEVANGTCLYQGSTEYVINCHIQDVVENAADYSHLGILHVPAVVGEEWFSNIIRHLWTDISWVPNDPSMRSITSLKDDDLDGQTNGSTKTDHSEKHMAVFKMKHRLEIFKKFNTLDFDITIIYLGPGYLDITLETALGTFRALQTITPIQPFLQRIVHIIYAPRLASPLAKFFFYGDSVMFRRDALVWDHKRFMDNPLLLAEEKALKIFHRWFKQFYTENSPTFESCKDTLDW